MAKNILTVTGLFSLFLLLAACAALDSGRDLPRTHPLADVLGFNPTKCTDCHDARDEKLAFGRFVHTPAWAQSHRQPAAQNETVCTMCHQVSFCNDCHANGAGMKPSIKNQGETYRNMPHRGDYLSRHRIDGRVDPTSCFRCHGNPKSAQTCVACHG